MSLSLRIAFDNWLQGTLSELNSEASDSFYNDHYVLSALKAAFKAGYETNLKEPEMSQEKQPIFTAKDATAALNAAELSFLKNDVSYMDDYDYDDDEDDYVGE